MKIISKSRQSLRGCQGMTLVEIMVAMVIVSIIAGIVWNVALTLMNNANKAGSILEQEGAPAGGFELLKRDLTWAGFGILDCEGAGCNNSKISAFFVRDGGSSGSDKIYINEGKYSALDKDSKYIGLQELNYDLGNKQGYAFIASGNGTAILTLILSKGLQYDEQRVTSCSNTTPLNLDECPAEYDTGYGDPVDRNEFKGGIWQYVITNTDDPDKKVARIESTSVNLTAKEATLTLDNPVKGVKSAVDLYDNVADEYLKPNEGKVSPAVYYCVDYDGTDLDCYPSDGRSQVLRRSSRDSNGLLPLANDIVDMQIAYRTGTRWYCDGTGTGTCRMDPFYAGRIDLIRISLVARVGTIPSTDPTYPNTISVENGPSWGNDGFVYRVFTTSIRPRNNIELENKL